MFVRQDLRKPLLWSWLWKNQQIELIEQNSESHSHKRKEHASSPWTKPDSSLSLYGESRASHFFEEWTKIAGQFIQAYHTCRNGTTYLLRSNKRLSENGQCTSFRTSLWLKKKVWEPYYWSWLREREIDCILCKQKHT